MNELVDLDAPDLQRAQTQRLESLGELASGIAHEINTPAQYVGDNVRFLQKEFANLLKLIASYRELLSSDYERLALIDQAEKEVDFDFLKTEIPQAIEQSLEGLDRVTTIVRAMKEFSHPGSAIMEPADLRTLVNSTVEVCRNRWKYVADLTTDFDPDLPLVPCLMAELNQVILNLIVNAADAIAEKYGSDGTRRGLITISLRTSGEFVEMRFADDGAGIPMSVRSRIFDQFFTTKTMGKGTGQGLARCRNVIVAKHGGSIDVESTEGTGTTFVLRLPLNQDAHLATASEAT